MAAKPEEWNGRFLATKAGTVHAVTTKTQDSKSSKCPVVKKGHADKSWGRRKGLSPEAALAMKDCSRCETHDLAETLKRRAMTPAQKRAEAKAKSDETREKLGLKDKPAKAKKEPREKKEPVRRGPKKSDPAAMMERAKEHLELAKDHGWKGSIEQAGETVTVEVKKDGELLRLIYEGGRIIHSRVTLRSGTEVKLRNSANWRRHAEGTGKIKKDYQPRQGTGKKAASRELAAEEANGVTDRRLPFSLDDEDPIIIKMLGGKMLTWRNGLSNSIDSAQVPVRSRNVRITQHPKSGRKMISFHELHGEGEHGEVLGGERTVYLDKILRVKD